MRVPGEPQFLIAPVIFGDLGRVPLAEALKDLSTATLGAVKRLPLGRSSPEHGKNAGLWEKRAAIPTARASKEGATLMRDTIASRVLQSAVRGRHDPQVRAAEKFADKDDKCP